MPLEQPLLPLPRWRQVLADFGPVYVAHGFMAFLFAATGPMAILLAVGSQGGLSQADIASWMFGGFFLNGLLSIAFCLVYRQPLAMFWTIPGAVLVGPALGHLSFPEVIGAYVVTGVLLLALGLSGWVSRVMALLPMPIVMAMVAGVFLRFGLGLVFAFRDDLWIAAPMAAAFVALSVLPRLGRALPPLIGALLVGAVMLALLGRFDPAPGILAIARPNLYAPVFSWNALAELVLPLAVSVLAAQNAQGYAVLRSAGHEAPVNAVTVACGVGSLASAFTGAVSTCLTGPVNAIIVADGERERQYTGAITVCLLVMVFALLAPFFTGLLLATPASFIATLAGLAMLRVLQGSFVTSFRGPFSFGALVTFLVTVADVPLFSIGAPFWALVFGYAASALFEPKDFTKPAE